MPRISFCKRDKSIGEEVEFIMDVSKARSDFQMIGSRIISITLKNDFVEIPDDEKVRRRIELSHTIREREEEEDFCDDAEMHQGLVVLTVKVDIRRGKDKFKLNLEIEGFFVAPLTGYTREGFREMLGINGIASIYSIARATAASISALAFPGGSVILPMINVYEYSKEVTAHSNDLDT